jgi:EmrB/QacA subfamily drug resistance transporter
MTDGVASSDPRRWLTLALALLAITIAVIDTTVLNVSIPTMRREFGSSLSSIEWVVTGYSLVFASLLVIGGRLGDLFGARRMVMIGAAIFGVGSFIASESESVAMLIIGEAVIEGMGAALLTPNTLSLIANTFTGKARTTAFAAWATAVSAGVILGPALGGYLTSEHSWRWAFRINLLIAPVVVLGMLLIAQPDRRPGRRPRLDLGGAVLIAAGTFLVIFGISQGSTYGYLRPLGEFAVLGTRLVPAGAPVSIVPLAFLAGGLAIYAFVRVERRKEASEGDPLFRMSEFRSRTFTVATVASSFTAFSQLAMSYCVPLFLQGSRDLSPLQNGIWMLPVGTASVVGAPVGGWLVRRGVDPTRALLIGLYVSASGLVLEAIYLTSDAVYWHVLPAFILYGFGSGLVMSQLNRVMLHEVSPDEMGAVGGMSATIRQASAASGVAVTGAIFAGVTRTHGIDAALRPAVLTAATAVVIAAVLASRLRPIGNGEDDERQAPALDDLIDSESQLSALALPAVDRER